MCNFCFVLFLRHICLHDGVYYFVERVTLPFTEKTNTREKKRPVPIYLLKDRQRQRVKKKPVKSQCY